MARSGSVPLLLLSMLLASAVAYDFEYGQLDGVTNAVPHPVTHPMEAESDCADFCSSKKLCSGYVYEDGVCQTYVGDCEVVPDLRPAPANYMAKIVCPVGTCDCPHGFEQYGARCLKLLDEPETDWFAANSKCSSESADAHAHLAVPRSEPENEQVQLARGDASAWLGVSERGNIWFGHDGCRTISDSQQFWASEQPDITGRVVFSSPPGPDGWHSQRMVDKNTPHRPLCQLAFCYRPECAEPMDCVGSGVC